MYLPVPVNFIFIGFDGKGNQGIQIWCSFCSFMFSVLCFFCLLKGWLFLNGSSCKSTFRIQASP